MATRFDKVSGALASRNRKRRYTGHRGKALAKKRNRSASKERCASMVSSVNGQLCRSLFGTGVNSGSTLSGVLEVVRLLDCAKKITRDSVFVDFGCSVGGVCMFIAARFGCKVIGIEKDANTVALGERYLSTHSRRRQLAAVVFLHPCRLYRRCRRSVFVETWRDARVCLRHCFLARRMARAVSRFSIWPARGWCELCEEARLPVAEFF